MSSQFKFIVRNITRKPVYTVITFTGFSLAIAASLLIYLWVYTEMSYDTFHSGHDRVYRVLTLQNQGDRIVKSANCYRPMAKTMKSDYPQIEAATYISYSSEDSPFSVESGGEKIEARTCWTNDDFFKIFNGFEFLEGSPENAFKDPADIILTEETAKKLFGDQPAYGKEVISDKFSKEIYNVSGVIRIPPQSHIDFGCIFSEKNLAYGMLSYNWGDGSWVRVYIKLRKDATIDDEFLRTIPDHISRYSKKADKLVFQPLADVHLYSDYQADYFNRNSGNIKYVLIFSGLAFLIILMASLNFSVLAVARASERAIEIGIRKVSGGTRMGIFVQFMKESVLQTFTATIAALLIVWLIIPLFNSLASVKLAFDFSAGFIVNLFLLTFFIGSIAGIYPSAYLSSFNPIGIFRRGSVSGSRSNFIRLLVTAQFSIAIFFIIATTLFAKQLNYIHNKDLGINDENIVVIPTGLWYNNVQFKDELLRNPNILSASASTYAPIDVGFRMPLPLSHQGHADTLYVNYFYVDEDFEKTYGLEVIKGQFLQLTNAAYWEESEKSGEAKKAGLDYAVSIPVVINETAEKLLGFDNPVGQRIGNKVIVGVVRDFHFRSLHYSIEPLIMTNNPEAISSMNIRISPGNTTETLNYIRDIYRKNRDGRKFSYTFFDDLLDAQYQAESRLKNMTVTFGILAIVISVLGILGMALFSINRRTREIGMRRVSGATNPEILIFLNADFIKWVLVAFLIATPVAWVILSRWIQNFVYKTGFSWWIFGLAGISAVCIALVTVTWQSWRAATRNPVEALRYE